MNHTLEKDILTTLVYWDVFSFPLTAFEVWQWRISSARLGGREQERSEHVPLMDVLDALEKLKQKELIEQSGGMFFLRGSGSLVERRRTRGKRSDRKLKALRFLVKLLRFVPFVRMIGVTGRLSYKNIGGESDWDVLIILKSGRIWTGRTLVTGFLHGIGKRRHGKYEKDRVCLNHFLSDDHLEIGLKDLFAAREYTLLVPLYGWEVFQKFQERNQWIREFLPEWHAETLPPLLFVPDSRLSKYVRGTLEQLFSLPVFDALERHLRSWQMRKIEANPKTHLPQGFIHANDEALIFLPSPQGPRVFERFVRRLTNLTRTNADTTRTDADSPC